MTVIYVLLGVVALVGSGGLIGVYRWAKKQGVRDAQIDLVVGVVLGDRHGGKPLKERLDAQDHKLDQIQREATPNGGNTSRLGDTVTRIEKKVDAQDTKLDAIDSKIDRHIGKSDEIHAEFRRRTAAVEKKLP